MDTSVEKLINIAILDGATELDLSGKKLTCLPKEIKFLTNLINLDLSGNRLTDLPKEFENLISLKNLNLCSNNFATIPSVVFKLVNLLTLDFSFNFIKTIPKDIKLLPNLCRLDLIKNELSSIPTEIGSLSNLRYLSLNTNKIRNIPTEISYLSELESLTLSSNLIDSFPLEICELYSLRTLTLSFNNISTIPAEIGQLVNLKELILLNNQIQRIHPGIGKLINLINLNLYSNKLIDLPFEINKLTNLTQLDLMENSLPIPPEIIHLKDKPSVIINFFIEYKSTSDKKELNEAKMILVGQGGVGKTSLVKMLIEGKYNRHEVKTEGIKISKWLVSSFGKEIKLNIWDFGGQEIMHATHQFFLTKRSLYTLVIDARQGDQDNKIEYWLKLIQSFGEESPIIVVINKVDQHYIEIDKKRLKQKYRNIKGFVYTSCQTGKGVQDLRQMISIEVGKIDHIHDQLLNSWFAIKNQLENMEKDYITYDEYVSMCINEDIKEPINQQTLIGFLHDLGVVLNFQDDFRLKDTNILNPEWVTNGVYTILNSYQLFKSKGFLEIEQLPKILDKVKYPSKKYLFIVNMMKKFELCFDIEGEQDRKFLIPELLSKEEPAFDWNYNNSQTIQYAYNFLPNSIISRFTVRMRFYIFETFYWRYGVIINHSNNKALIKADLEDKKITVSIVGNKEMRRSVIATIRSSFEYIHKTIPRLEIKELVALPDHKEVLVEYEHLLTLERLGIESFVPVGLEKPVFVKEILDGVENPQTRQERLEKQFADRMEENSIRNQLNTNNIFIEFNGTGDKYKISQAGAVGQNSHAHDITLNQIWNKNATNIDLVMLAAELKKLRTEMTNEAKVLEHYISIANIASAETEAMSGNVAKVLEHMSKVSNWVLDIAIRLGVNIVIKILRN